MIEPPLQLVAFEYRTRLEGGVTRPLLMAAMDESDREYLLVLKPRLPDASTGHYGGTSLACELVVSMLARHVGLPVPDYAVVDVPREILPGISDRSVRALLTRNVGQNFGCVYHEGMKLWEPTHRPRSSDGFDALEDVLALDATVINGDRKKEKPNLLVRGDSMILIDHSLALPAHLWANEQIEESPLLPDEQILEHCTQEALYERGRPFERLHTRWQAELAATDLDRIRAAIPPDWERRGGDLERIFSFLARRSARFTDIQVALRRIVR